MILFHSETKFCMPFKATYKKWLKEIAKQEKKRIGNINIVFYNDEQLSALNKQYLNHKSLTDIITFDYSEKDILHGDICISIERVKENAKKFHTFFEEELSRVMGHGLLHLCGYKDKNKAEKSLMKQKEEGVLLLFRSLCNEW